MEINEIKNLHPCFNRINNKGRMHLPVSPACNIMCEFCDRRIGDEGEEIRPGLSKTLISPEEAPDYVAEALRLCPEITVVGIAGPGDTLATDHAMRAFRAIGKRFPALIKCMSTNGLLLPEKIKEIVDVGVTTLTVTVNAVDPAILSRLNRGILYEGRLYEGEAAALILIGKQLEGIKMAADAGLIVKVNTVLVPGINGSHIGAVARQVGRRGASIFNIIPLIPQNGLKDCQAPDCGEIDAARLEAEAHIPVFRHCEHCRADAVGLLGGKDVGGQIYRQRIRDTFSHG
ncbi:putative nitrogenase cofactor biosynthesis protein NifB [Clostridia bacterium]|nr:putative nitrogenase cofactor biosynthesis protein NifB [Clostridia bacterium]